MRLEASCGNAPKSVDLRDSVYSLRLVAENQGERQWLAGLFAAIGSATNGIRLKAARPNLRIVEGEPKRGK